MSSVLYNLAESGKRQFGEGVFRRPFSNDTLERVAWLQNPQDYTQQLHQAYSGTDRDFDACEFVDYHNTVCDYSRDASVENAKRVAGHSYRRRFYRQGDPSAQEAAINYGTQIMANFGSVGTYWAD